MIRTALRLLNSLCAIATPGAKSARGRRRIFFEPLEEKGFVGHGANGFHRDGCRHRTLQPTSLDISHGRRVFVAQQNGVIRIVENDALVPTPFASLTVDSKGERGLLGITLDPDFDHNHYLYI